MTLPDRLDVVSPAPATTVAAPIRTRIEADTLWLENTAVLTALPANRWTTVTDPTGVGTFLSTLATPATATVTLPVGAIHRLQRFTGAARRGPFWVQPTVGHSPSEIRPSTLWLLAETKDAPNSFVILVPLLGSTAAFTLGSTNGQIQLTGETGDPALPCVDGVALFVAHGADPYQLLRSAARAVHHHHHGFEPPIRSRPIPTFADHFGWCTWDAFYHDVSPAKIRTGLQSFATLGVSPRFLVLDDGWQSVQQTATGEQRLIDLRPNVGFGGDLAPLIDAAKSEFGIETFLVWHALIGYWGGVCGNALPAYHSRSVARTFSSALLATDTPDGDLNKWGPLIGVPSVDAIARFFDDYHCSLRAQGVDGVKVDNQAALEAVSTGQGGRVQLARIYRTALEASVRRYFDGRIINCMSCSPEGVYLAASSLMRTSDDYWPLRPESHGAHLYTNAHASLWFGEFIYPDWDMFQSRHPFGAYHAAARAVSGGLVYVSDAPDQHDEIVLRKLVLSDGSVLRADGPGRITRDGLFTDPTAGSALLKIFNRNRECGLLGVFNLRAPGSTAGEDARGEGTTSPSDVEGLRGDTFISYHHRRGTIERVTHATRTPLSLPAGGWEIVSYAPIDEGFATLGLADKLNSTGAIIAQRKASHAVREITLRDGGQFLAWSALRPYALTCDAESIPFGFDPATGAITAQVPLGGPCRVSVVWI